MKMDEIKEIRLSEYEGRRMELREGRKLPDSELTQVTGGEFFKNEIWDNPNGVIPRFKVGDHVEVTSGWGWGTVGCTVEAVYLTRILDVNNGNAYMATYYVKANDPSFFTFSEGTVTLSEIEVPGTTGSFYY